LERRRRRRLLPPAAAVAALRLHPSATVLDYGCGTGHFAIPIATQLDRQCGGRLIAVDIRRDALRVVQERAQRQGLEDRIQPLEVAHGAELQLPLADCSANRILMANVYAELAEPTRPLQELARVICPGGLLLVLDWRRRGESEVGPPCEHRPLPEQVIRSLAAAGFAEIELLPLYRDFFVIQAAPADAQEQPRPGAIP
jgi:ubiquinone/menaquinone biosynthesis C-methylase UbiE